MIKNGLGKGLDALFQSDQNDSRIAEYILQGILKEIKISDIDPNVYQPRKTFDELSLNELADSIRIHGVIQPVIVKSTGQRYILVAGERRWRAARIAGLSVIPAIVKDSDKAETMEIALVENLQREDLNPIDEAVGIKQLIDLHGLTQDKVSERIGKSRPSIANSLRLLSLPAEIIDFVAQGKLSPGHARAILSVEDDKAKLEIAKRAMDAGLNVRQLEEIVKKIKKDKQVKKNHTSKPQHISTIEATLAEYFGTKVEVTSGRKKGTIHIEFYDENDLERIMEILFKE